MLRFIVPLLCILNAKTDDITVLNGGTIITVTKETIDDGMIVIKQGKISFVGNKGGTEVPQGAKVIDTSGKYIMPGIIDAHSHMGVYPWPDFKAHADGNEMTDPVTPHVRAEDAFYTQDPAIKRAVAGGTTTILVIPGSGNMIGGQGIVLKLKVGKHLDEMKFTGAPAHMKMASGENPKRVYGSKGQYPSTRMGNFSILREYLTKTREYMDKWATYTDKIARGESADPPDTDMKLESLAKVLKGETRVQIHCYRADEILTLIAISKEFGFKISGLHHALDAYKVAEQVAKEGIGVATFTDWWGYKVEAWDGNVYAPAILNKHGVRVAIKSDSPDHVQRLYHEAAKLVKYDYPPDEAIRTITINPAVILGIEKFVGSIETGKDADIAVFSRHPFDMYTLCEMTIIDGEVVFDRSVHGDYWGKVDDK